MSLQYADEAFGDLAQQYLCGVLCSRSRKQFDHFHGNLGSFLFPCTTAMSAFQISHLSLQFIWTARTQSDRKGPNWLNLN
eukprot:1015478-Pelagomonas_calceolata.AAC.1